MDRPAATDTGANVHGMIPSPQESPQESQEQGLEERTREPKMAGKVPE